jgi:integrase
VAALLSHLDRPDDARALRDRALLVIFALTGRRRAEVARLRAGDLERDGEGRTLYRYVGKGGKGGLRELPPPAVEALGVYLAAAGRADLPADAPLFLSVAGRHRGEALGADSILRILKTRATEAGLDPASVRVHGLRHLAAELRRAAGAAVEEVSAFLDHESLATTATYLRRTEGTRDAGWRGAWDLIGRNV